MTRTEWILHWRDVRIRARENRTPIPQGAVMRALRSVYSYHFTPSQSAFMRLTQRYWSRLSYESKLARKKKIHSWMPEARASAKEMFKALVYSKNTMITLIPKTDQPSGLYYPIPLTFRSAP